MEHFLIIIGLKSTYLYSVYQVEIEQKNFKVIKAFSILQKFDCNCGCGNYKVK